VKLHIERRGRSGGPLVLIHGWGFHSAVWDTLSNLLASEFSLYLVDLPGHGYSPDPMPGCSLDETVATLAQAVPHHSTWLGWSLGGLVALASALVRPERVGQLLLVASAPRFVAGPDWPHGVASDLLDSFAAELACDLPGTLSRFVALQSRGAAQAARTAHRLARVLREGPPARTSGLDCGLAWLRDTDLRDRISEVRCPARVLLGERDTIVSPALLPDILALHPDWRGEVLAGAGHAPFLADPDGFRRTLLGAPLNVT